MDPETPKEKKRLRPEGVIALVALACFVGLLAVAVLCIPYYSLSADPESLLQNIREHAQRQEQVDPLEPTEDIPEETAEPTIPPEANPYTKFDFQYGKHNYLYCTRQDSYPGIDVSSFQGKINWKKVKDSGIRYAMIRLGYRGYGQAGNMVEDEYARRNLEEAQKAGLEIGVYFFSQATSIDEVDDEIFFFMQILGIPGSPCPWSWTGNTSPTPPAPPTWTPGP